MRKATLQYSGKNDDDDGDDDDDDITWQGLKYRLVYSQCLVKNLFTKVVY